MDAPKTWDRDRLLRLLSLASVAVLAMVLTWRTDASYDTGFHLATGRWILSHHAWPRLDPFTYTVSTHPYITMHGLFQVLLALADRVGGDRGMSVLRLLFVLATFGIVWATCRRRGVRSPILLLSGSAIALLASEVRFSLRPELFTFVCLAAMLYLLTRYRDEHRARRLWSVLIVQVLWVNGHALSPLGPAVLGVHAMCGLLDPATRRDRAPWIVFVASCLALLANPYGIAGATFSLGLATRLQPENAFARSIVELASSFSSEFASMRPVIVYKILLAVSIAAIVLDRIAPGRAIGRPGSGAASAPGAKGRGASRPSSMGAGVPRPPAFDIAVVAMFAALSVRAVRNIPLFAVAALPPVLVVVERQLMRIPAGAGRRRRISDLAFAVVVLGLVVFPVQQVMSNAWYIDDRRAEAFGSGVSPGMLPTKTLDYIVDHGLHGPIYNHINFGGALIGRLWPNERVFIDGRLEVMGEEFFESWQRIESGPGWDEMIARYDPNLLLVPNSELPLLHHVANDPHWAMVEWDGAAALFLRQRGSGADSALIAAARARIARLADPRDPLAIAPPDHRSVSLWARSFGPRHYLGDTWGEANALYGIREYAAARREYQRAVRESDRDYVPLLLGLASADERCGRWDEALRWYDRVLELEPRNTVARERGQAIRSSGG